jgi:hypothetical protein
MKWVILLAMVSVGVFSGEYVAENIPASKLQDRAPAVQNYERQQEEWSEADLQIQAEEARPDFQAIDAEEEIDSSIEDGQSPNGG